MEIGTIAFPLIKLAKKLKDGYVVFEQSGGTNEKMFPLIKLAKKLKVY